MNTEKKPDYFVKICMLIIVILLGVDCIAVTLATKVSQRRNETAAYKIALSNSDTVSQNQPDRNVIENRPQETSSSDRIPNIDHKNSNVVIAGMKTWNIDANSRYVECPLYNPEANVDYNMYIELEWCNGQGEYEIIYRSDLISAGQKLGRIELTREIPAGVYENCVAHIQPYRISDNTATNNADVGFTLYSR